MLLLPYVKSCSFMCCEVAWRARHYCLINLWKGWLLLYLISYPCKYCWFLHNQFQYWSFYSSSKSIRSFSIKKKRTLATRCYYNYSYWIILIDKTHIISFFYYYKSHLYAWNQLWSSHDKDSLCYCSASLPISSECFSL